MTLYVLLSLIRWIAIYPFDSVIRPLYNWALAGKGIVCMDLRFDKKRSLWRF